MNEEKKEGEGEEEGGGEKGKKVERGDGEGGDVGKKNGTGKKGEDEMSKALEEEVLEALGIVVKIVPDVAEDMDEEHLKEAVVPH